MDAYSYVQSVIKKLGYICDTSPYLIDYQYRLFSKRLSKGCLSDNSRAGHFGLHDFFCLTKYSGTA